jgi:hypothetical protein
MTSTPYSCLLHRETFYSDQKPEKMLTCVTLIQCATVTRTSQRGQLGYKFHGQNSARADRPTITSCVMVGTMIFGIAPAQPTFMFVGDRILTQPASWMLYTAKAWSLH